MLADIRDRPDLREEAGPVGVNGQSELARARTGPAIHAIAVPFDPAVPANRPSSASSCRVITSWIRNRYGAASAVSCFAAPRCSGAVLRLLRAITGSLLMRGPHACAIVRRFVLGSSSSRVRRVAFLTATQRGWARTADERAREIDGRRPSPSRTRRGSSDCIRLMPRRLGAKAVPTPFGDAGGRCVA